MNAAHLATICPCGHTANYHFTEKEQDAYRQWSKGRYSRNCTGHPRGPGACHCYASREAVVEADS